MSTKRKVTFAEIRVGILVIMALAILVVFMLSVTGDIALFKKTMVIKTRFSAGEGLKEGDEVRLAGKRIGKIESVDFAPGIPSDVNQKSIVVTMRVDAAEVGERIRTDSQAVLAQQGFLGDRIVDITQGTTKGQKVSDGAMIESADQAGLAQVFQGASDVLVQFNTLGKQLQELMDNINKGQGTVGRLLHDDTLFVNLNRTILEGQDLLKRVGQGEGTIAQLVNDPKLYGDLRSAASDVQTIVADLKAGKGSVGKLLKDEQLYQQATDAVAKANKTIEKLDQIAADIESGHGTIGKLIKDEKIHDDIKATLASLRSVSETLDRGEGTAGKFLHDDKLYENVNQLSAEAVKMLYDFRQNPKKYLSIKVSLF